MTPEAQRIAIALACGWTAISYEEGEDVDIESRSIYPWEGVRGLPPKSAVPRYQPHKRRFLPDYLTDLNAMHEAEKILNQDLRNKYMKLLGHVDMLWGAYTATASQRAEAFLRTIGKCDDSK